MSLSTPNHTQISNDFLDSWMQKLDGSAIKCFLAICRKTIGWHKECEEVSYSQLMDMTGLSRRGVACAIKVLLKADLITAEKRDKKTTVYGVAFQSSRLLSSPDLGYSVAQTDLASGTNNRDPSNMSSSNQIKKRERKLDNSTTPSSGTRVPKPQSSVEKDLGKKAKICLDYYFEKHTTKREFEPMIDGGRDMGIFKRILKADYTVEAIKQVIDFFFDYDKRSKFTTRALYNSFDTLYGVLKDRVEGRR